VSTLVGEAGNAGKAGNRSFSGFDWNGRKAIGFSSTLAGKAGILFLGLIIINGNIR